MKETESWYTLTFGVCLAERSEAAKPSLGDPPRRVCRLRGVGRGRLHLSTRVTACRSVQKRPPVTRAKAHGLVLQPVGRLRGESDRLASALLPSSVTSSWHGHPTLYSFGVAAYKSRRAVPDPRSPMGRPPQITTDQILEAARTLFLERGPSVTTAEIAECAGCSEGTLFRRFPTKEALFVKAVACVDLPAWDELSTPRAPDESIEDRLQRIAEAVVDMMLQLMPRVMMMKSRLNLSPAEMFASLGASPPAEAIRQLTRYLEAERRSGAVVTADPEVVARIFLGALHHYAFCEHAGINDLLPMPRESFLRQLARHTALGLAP